MFILLFSLLFYLLVSDETLNMKGVEFIFLEETSLTDETNTVSDNQE